MEKFDYEQHEPDLGGNALACLRDLVQAQLAAQEEVDRLTRELKHAKLVLLNIAERRFPGLMKELGLQSFTTPEGLSISVVSKLRAAISEGNAEEAFVWLENNGHSGIVKTQVTIDLPMGSPELEQIRKVILDHVPGAAVQAKKAIHPSTLTAFLSERVSEGEDVPLRLFGAYQQQTTKICGGK